MMSAPGRRATSPSKTPLLCLLAVALALTLAPVAEARVQVRPVEQTVVLDLFSPSDFNDLGVQRDFCRAFTASIDLDERVGRVKTFQLSNPPYAPSRIFRAVTRDPASRYDSSVSSLAAHFLDVPRDTRRSSCAS